MAICRVSSINLSLKPNDYVGACITSQGKSKHVIANKSLATQLMCVVQKTKSKLIIFIWTAGDVSLPTSVVEARNVPGALTLGWGAGLGHALRTASGHKMSLKPFGWPGYTIVEEPHGILTWGCHGRLPWHLHKALVQRYGGKHLGKNKPSPWENVPCPQTFFNDPFVNHNRHHHLDS